MEQASIEALFLAWRANSDLRALAQVFDETAPELYAVARHLARGTSEAEDLVQACFLAAIERAASYDPARPLRPWLFGILGNEARKLRSRRATLSLPERAAAGAEPLDLLLGEELRSAVASAVSSLPPHYASAVALHLEQGLPPREIATRLSIPSELARTHLSRGLAWLRRALPEGLSAGAWIASADFRSLRERVLEKAGLAHAAAPALPALLLCALLLVPLCAVGGGVAWLLGAKSPASVAVADAHAPSTPLAQPALEASAPATAREPLAPAPADERAKLHGRILLAGGAPAAGAEVHASTFSMAERRTLELGSAACDAQGNFAFALEVVEGQYISLRVQPAGFVNASGSFGPLAPGSETDTGEVVLPRAGVLAGKLVDAQARPLAEGWELMSSADAPQTHPANKRWAFWGAAPVDAATGIAHLEGLPAGEMKIVARSKLSFDQIQIAVKIVEGAETAAEFRYDGPDLTQRVLLRARPKLPALIAFHPEASSIQLLRAGADKPLVAIAPARRAPGEYLFDGLPDGDYALEVDDPQFERWSEPHTRPGHAYSAALEGAAAVKLRVLGPDGAPLARYGLQIAFPDVNFRPNTGELLPKKSLAPADGLLKGLVPIHCALTIHPEGLAERSLDVPLLKRGETRELTLDYRSSVAIRGRVVDDQGKPLEGVVLELTRGDRAGSASSGFVSILRNGEVQPSRPIQAQVKSDTQGEFTFLDLERGSFSVRACFSRWLLRDQTLILGAETAPALVFARPACGYLAGRVVLPAGVDPASVSLVIGDEIAPPHLRPAQDGTFRAGPLPIGTLALSAVVQGGARADGSSSESFGVFRELGRFEIQAGRDTERVFDLAGGMPPRIAVEARAGGSALEQGWVVALLESQPDDPDPDLIALGAQGHATLALSRTGPVRLALVARELGWVWRSDESLQGKNGDTLQRKLDVSLVKHTLKCLDAATRAPLANQQIRWGAKLAGLEAAAHAKTDANGLLELSLPAGRHEFFAESAAKGTVLEWSLGGVDPLEILLPPAH